MRVRSVLLCLAMAVSGAFCSEKAFPWSDGRYAPSAARLSFSPGDLVNSSLELEGRVWTARVEEATGRVHRAYGSPLPMTGGAPASSSAALRACMVFMQECPGLFSVGPEELVPQAVRRMGRFWYLNFEQVSGGVPVLGGRVLFRVRDDGQLVMFGDEGIRGVGAAGFPLLGGDAASTAAREEVSFDHAEDEEVGSRLVLVPSARGGEREDELCWEVHLRTLHPLGDWFILVDAGDGEILEKVNRLRGYSIRGTVSGQMLAQFYDEEPVPVPFRNETVEVVTADSAVTNSRGNYSVPVDSPGAYTVVSSLCGPYVDVANDDGSSAIHVKTANTDEAHSWMWRFGDDGLPEEINTYYHVNRIHDWIKNEPFGFDGLDYRMIVTVRWGTGVNGAFYNGKDIWLGEGDSTTPDGMRSLALFSDVIYHECGHAITDRIYNSPGGMEYAAMQEGFSDYVAATLNDDPLLGNGGLYVRKPYTRNLYNDLRYPEDFGVSPHEDGQIIAGALWDLRVSEGRQLADSLWFYAIQGEPMTFEDFLLEVLLADDDDGDLSNGTPHQCAIDYAFGRHGIGPGVDITMEHAPNKDSENTSEPYPVFVKVFSSGRTPPVKLNYMGRRDRDYQGVWMVRTGEPYEYAAEIPPQPLGTVVSYFFEARCVRLPPGAPESSVFSFYVGGDSTPPVIVHSALPDQAVQGWPVEVRALITDNIAVKPFPVIVYRVNAAAEDSADMARLGESDVYYADISAPVSYGDFVEYRIVARDSSAAENGSHWPSANSYHAFNVCQGYSNDMENGSAGWTHTGTPGYVDEWRLTERRHVGASDSMSWGCGQDSGDYSNVNHSILETAMINVDYDSRLIFWHRMNADTLDFSRAYDGGIVEASRDSGNSWDVVYPDGGYPFMMLASDTNPIPGGIRCYSGSFDWKLAEFNLAAYYGDTKIRFRFGSNGSRTAEGWYIDDFEVINCPAPGVSEHSLNAARSPSFYLAIPFPNPLTSRIVLKYSDSASAWRSLRIFNVAGQLVRTLADGAEPSGERSVVWSGEDEDGRPVPSGIYFAVLQSQGNTASRKIQLVR